MEVKQCYLITNGSLKKSKRKLKSTHRQNDNQNTAIQNLCNEAKALKRGNFSVIISENKKNPK